MLYNLHTHTYRCNHAKGEDREYVEAAIGAGLGVLGFSDHSPQFFKPHGYYSHFRMRPGQFEDYVTSIRALQREYRDDIRILLGLETEYYPECFDRLCEFIAPFEIDYMILGQHFVGNEYDEELYLDNGKYGERYLRQYIKQVSEALSTGEFTCFAHPDIAYFGGSRDVYEREMSKLCAVAKQLDVPLEFNMLGYQNGRSYPDPAFWRVAARTGNKTVLGFDAHSPKALSNTDVYNECHGKLAKLGITPAAWDTFAVAKP